MQDQPAPMGDMRKIFAYASCKKDPTQTLNVKLITKSQHIVEKTFSAQSKFIRYSKYKRLLSESN